jgi:chaperonin cofactor prefoldin
MSPHRDWPIAEMTEENQPAKREKVRQFERAVEREEKRRLKLIVVFMWLLLIPAAVAVGVWFWSVNRGAYFSTLEGDIEEAKDSSESAQAAAVRARELAKSAETAGRLFASQKFQALQNERDALSERLHSLETQIAGLENRTDTLQARLDDLDSALNKVDSLEKSVQALNARLSAVETNIGALTQSAPSAAKVTHLHEMTRAAIKRLERLETEAHRVFAIAERETGDFVGAESILGYGLKIRVGKHSRIKEGEHTRDIIRDVAIYDSLGQKLYPKGEQETGDLAVGQNIRLLGPEEGMHRITVVNVLNQILWGRDIIVFELVARGKD